MKASWLLLFCVGAAVAAKSWKPKWKWLDDIKRWHYSRPECEEKAKFTGICRASFPRFSYNWKTKRCESFIYGGCKGTRNNFEKIEICEAMCSSRVPIECQRCRETKNSEKVEHCVKNCIDKTAKGEIKNEENSNFVKLK